MAGPEMSPPLTSREQMIEAMSAGAKPRAAWRIGTEHEKHVYRKNPVRPVPYEGGDGVRALLAGIQERTGWTYFYDHDNPIGLRNLEPIGGISLEPGGQFELSGAPQPTIHDAAKELDAHLADCHAVGEALNIHFLGLGTTPIWPVRDIPRMPKSRYGIMTPYMDRVGTLGTSMMYRSATIQANVDFADEADMVLKMRVSLALQPIVTALFANSPFIDGKPSGYLSFRSHIWLNTDPGRTGMLPFVFDEGFGFDRYVEYALDVPMYFVIRDGQYVNVAGESFRAFLRGELPQLPGDKPSVKDWVNHLSTLFPEVRLKNYLEMRGADMGDRAHVLALPALWVGLLYDADALGEVWDRLKSWTADEMRWLRRAVPETAIHTSFRGCLLSDMAREIVDLGRAGLRRRGFGEEVYLAPLDETLALDKTPAERWLDKFHGEWGGDLTRIFDEAEI
jgi:glutamate--cysteine ligase